MSIVCLSPCLILAGYLEESIKPTELTQQPKQPRKTTATASRKNEDTNNSYQMPKTLPLAQPNEEMHPIAWGETIRIYLKKGDRAEREKIAKLAKQFIDIYVEEGEDSEQKTNSS